MARTALYLMFNDWSIANYKIGNSNLPGRRQAEICFSYGVEPRIITDVWFTSKEAAQRAELYWHRFFRDQQTDDHGGREWFSLTAADVEHFKSWADLGKSHKQITAWLFGTGAPRREQDAYNRTLLSAIPRRPHPPSIDVWTNKDALTD